MYVDLLSLPAIEAKQMMKLRSFRGGWNQVVGDVMPNRQKNKNPLITTKFGDIVGFAFIKM